MRLKSFMRGIIILIIAGFIVPTIILAQETTGSNTTAGKTNDEATLNADGSYSSKAYSEAERPEDSYLAKFHAQDIVNKLIKINLDQIYMLKVIVTNFSDKGWKGDYDKCYATYKHGMELYYKRNIVYARVELEKNRKEINDLMKKIIDEYRKDANDMLSVCADQILLMHLEATTMSDPTRNAMLTLNQDRLRIGYSQFDESISSEREHYFDGAIYHLRIAKGYAIRILEDLAKPEDKAGVSSKYKVHKADNLNRVFREAGAAPATTAPSAQ